MTNKCNPSGLFSGISPGGFFEPIVVSTECLIVASVGPFNLRGVAANAKTEQNGDELAYYAKCSLFFLTI